MAVESAVEVGTAPDRNFRVHAREDVIRKDGKLGISPIEMSKTINF
jgi:hypothetical protein